MSRVKKSRCFFGQPVVHFIHMPSSGEMRAPSALPRPEKGVVRLNEHATRRKDGKCLTAVSPHG